MLRFELRTQNDNTVKPSGQSLAKVYKLSN